MLERLFTGAAADLLVEVAVVEDQEWIRRYLHPREFAEAAKKLAGRADVFFGPVLRKDESPKKDATATGRALWVDYDDSDLPVPGPVLPPSAVVSSGRGWHLYWLLEEFISPSRIEHLNKVLIEHVGGAADRGTWDATRVLRVPGTQNSKRRKGVVLMTYPWYTYSVADIEWLATADPTLLRKILHGDSRGYRSRSELDFAVIRGLLSEGVSEDAIFAIFEEQAVGEKYREHEKPDHYLSRTISAVKKEGTQRSSSGLFIRGNSYYVHTKRGARQVSTFVFEPRLLLEGPQEDALLGSIRSEGTDFVWGDITLTRRAFTSVRALTAQLPKASWQWLGSDSEVRALLPLLVATLQEKGMPRVRAVTCAGRHGPYFVTPSMTLGAQTVWEAPEGPMIFLRESPGIEVPDISPGPSLPRERLSEILGETLDINVPSVVYPILGWWLAAPLKPAIEAAGYRFPLLNLFGTRGSGKTATLTEVMMRLMAYRHRITFDSSTTRFVMLTLLGSSNALPVALSEFRQAGDTDQLRRYVLLAYDIAHDPRGRPDRTVEDFPLSAPFTVDGEDMLSDAAVRQRMVGVRLRPDDIAEGSPAYLAFLNLQHTPLESFAVPYLQYTLGVDLVPLLREAEALCREAFPEQLPTRVRRNFIVVILGLLLGRDFAGLDIPVLRDVLFEPLSFSYHPTLGRGRLHVDEFVEVLVGAIERGTTAFFWRAEEYVLWFQLTPALAWWRKECRRWGSEALGREAIAAQLEEVSYALGAQLVEERWCYGIDLRLAAETGLDVPGRLNMGQVTLQFPIGGG